MTPGRQLPGIAALMVAAACAGCAVSPHEVPATATPSLMDQTSLDGRLIVLELARLARTGELVQRDYMDGGAFRNMMGPFTATDREPPTDAWASRIVRSLGTNSCLSQGVVGWTKLESGPVAGHLGGTLRFSESQEHPQRTEACAAFKADTLRNVFGNPVKSTGVFPADGSPPLHGSYVFGPKTHPWGHTTVDYKFATDDGIETSMTFAILGNGMVRYFSMHSKRATR